MPIDNAHQPLYDDVGYYITIDCTQAAEYITAYLLAAESTLTHVGPGARQAWPGPRCFRLFLSQRADRTAASWYREIGAKMMELLPNAETVTLKGHHHGAIWTAPDVVAQRVVEFIDRMQAKE